MMTLHWPLRSSARPIGCLRRRGTAPNCGTVDRRRSAPVQPMARRSSRGDGPPRDVATARRGLLMAMEMKGEVALPADRQTVWAKLNDPDVLKACIPGVQALEKTGDTTFSVTAKMKIGPVSATFKGRVETVEHRSAERLPDQRRGRRRRRRLCQGRCRRQPRRRAGGHQALLRRAGERGRQDRPDGRPPDRRRRQEDGRPVLQSVRGGGGEVAEWQRSRIK